jgi:hypothetical protein
VGLENRGWDTVFCRSCKEKGIKKLIRINKTETCVECRSMPCKKCGTLTTSKALKCFKCNKPNAHKKMVEKREARNSIRASRLAGKE